MQLTRFFIGLLMLSFFGGSCNYFNIEKTDRNAIKNEQIEVVKKKALKNYPEIYACDEQENAKICFERQLNEHLGTKLTGVAVDENEITKDTLWLTVHVSNTGVLSLSPLKNINEEYAYLHDTIQKALDDISPIKPAFINSVTVNCNFKLPLVIKDIE